MNEENIDGHPTPEQVYGDEEEISKEAGKPCNHEYFYSANGVLFCQVQKRQFSDGEK
jgi:hypothetical protein